MVFTAFGDLKNHANSEQVSKPTSANTGCRHSAVASGGWFDNASITITQRCAIICVGVVISSDSTQKVRILRGGSDRVTEYTLSAADAGGFYVHLVYSFEVLDAGTYDYALENNNAGAVNSAGSGFKIDAVNIQ